jgi:hypothetical protein
MARSQAGHYTLIRSGITNEPEAEQLARGTSGDAPAVDTECKRAARRASLLEGRRPRPARPRSKSQPWTQAS